MAVIDKNLKVLIVDDSQSMIRTVANMLRIIGFEKVVRADDGDVALDKLRSENIDLILSDWNMPRMKGIELLRAVREDDQLKAMPFLMITGEIDVATVAEAGEVEVDGYLLKPFTLDDLKSRINEILEKKRTPSVIDVHLSVAKVYFDARQYQMAQEELKKALKVNPKNPRLSLALGQVYEEQGDLETAKKLYQRSVEFGYLFLKGHEALAKVYQAQGDLAAATEHLKRAVAISPNNIDRQLSLSQVLIKTGQKEDVQKILKNIMLLADKNQSGVALLVGEAYLEAGMAAEAQEIFSQALLLDPKAIHVYNRLGMALRRQKKFVEAIENYRRAIQIDPENEGLYYNLGRTYFDAGERDRAIAAMKRALKILPEFEEAKKFLFRIGANEG